jgi:hypothetical protein
MSNLLLKYGSNKFRYVTGLTGGPGTLEACRWTLDGGLTGLDDNILYIEFPSSSWELGKSQKKLKNLF